MLRHSPVLHAARLTVCRSRVWTFVLPAPACAYAPCSRKSRCLLRGDVKPVHETPYGVTTRCCGGSWTRGQCARLWTRTRSFTCTCTRGAREARRTARTRRWAALCWTCAALRARFRVATGPTRQRRHSGTTWRGTTPASCCCRRGSWHCSPRCRPAVAPAVPAAGPGSWTCHLQCGSRWRKCPPC